MRNGDGKEKSSIRGDEQAGEDWLHSSSRRGTHVSGDSSYVEREGGNEPSISGCDDGGHQIPSAPWFGDVINKQLESVVFEVSGDADTEIHKLSRYPSHIVNTYDYDNNIENMINHPPHYSSGGFECIEAIEAQLTKEEYRGYLKGNVAKYIWREKHKGGVESLKKAQWYLTRLIDTN